MRIGCRSEERQQKDQAIRERQDKRLLEGLEKLSRRLGQRKKKPLTEAQVHPAIGRLRERYTRVGRYYQIRYDAGRRSLSWEQQEEKKRRAERWDGSYVLQTDRRDMTQEEIFHHLERRVETHIFLCVLACHLLVSIEKTFLDPGIHTSWATLREQQATHQVVTVVLPTSDGEGLRIRTATTPEAEHKQIYQALRISEKILEPIRRRNSH